MPFKSQAQKAFLYANHPNVAQEYAAHTAPDASLPMKAPTPKSTWKGVVDKLKSESDSTLKKGKY